MLLRRLFRLPTDDRPELLGSIEAILRRAERPARSPLSPSVLHPRVAPALARIAASLRDETRPLPDVLRRALRAFLVDGAASPLYGRDELGALLAAEALANRFAPARRSAGWA